ncbi:hypothetical protein [Halomonas maura]|uniref:hypothetical protein n=1 Tax=Halomonas maura TaxID=117606 RepID=UPI0025B4A234|nr:hypothetical protein [Halomonas maura]MDN3554852.1 hypothetical protein [Halomonas maura]
MLRRLFGRKPLYCWVIKQVDEGLLHLCGNGVLHTELKHRQAKDQLRSGEYHGGVRIVDTGIVLNSNLFAALVPEEDLHLDRCFRANWQGRSWNISKVPQRCWAWEGRLITQANPISSLPELVSCEDLSALEKNVDVSSTLPRGIFAYRCSSDLQEPIVEVSSSFENA